MIRIWISMVLLGTAFPSLAVVQISKESCATPDFGAKFQSLVAGERALGEAYNKIVLASGTQKVSNCRFEVPYENGKPTDGLRKLVLDHTWYTVEIINGLEKQIYHRHALSVDYRVRELPLVGGGIAVTREVVNLQICRSPSGCQQIGVN